MAILERRAGSGATTPARPAAERIDLAEYIRAAFDGAVGDIDLPATFALAQPGDVGRDGFTDPQRAVYRQIERCLAGRARRSLTESERTKVGIAVVSEWNSRAIAAAWFHTSDGRYFASDADRRAHQRSLDERAEREAARQRARAAGELGAA